MSCEIVPKIINKCVINQRAEIEVSAEDDLVTGIAGAFTSYIVPAGKKVKLSVIIFGEEISV